jgi:hypothetical protein
MTVNERLVAMPVSMGFAGRIGRVVLVLVVFVVTMPVLVLHCLVRMLMIMPLGQMAKSRAPLGRRRPRAALIAARPA